MKRSWFYVGGPAGEALRARLESVPTHLWPSSRWLSSRRTATSVPVVALRRVDAWKPTLSGSRS